MKSKTLRIHPADNAEVALTNLTKGETITGSGGYDYTLLNNIPAKHKFATRALNDNEEIIMYGVLVGRAKGPIRQGELLSLKNVRHAAGEYRVRERKTSWDVPGIAAWKDRTFMGFHRSDGSVGTANYWLIIPLVFCENKNVQSLQDAFVKELGYRIEVNPHQRRLRRMVQQYKSGKEPVEEALDEEAEGSLPEEEGQRIFPNVDGVKLLTHTLGCGGTKEDATTLCGLLAGYITHPNVAGATVLSLGCQNAQASILKQEILQRDKDFSKPLYIFEQQEIGNEALLMQKAINATFAGLMQADKLSRKPAPLSKLCVGLECGGSDGFSGLSANPALGYAADLLVALGASVVLSEFPELCGVEQELSDRCVDATTAERFVELMSAYHARAKAVGSGFDANPSAGNIRDGLITDAIKSAGAAKKGGTSPVEDVLDYPHKIRKPGLSLLCTPGSDIESTTAEVGAGATVVVFTTGLGTPTGNPIAPVLKVASNQPLFQKMHDIIDINAGTIITGEETIPEVGARILDYIIQVAGGEKKAKATRLGHDDFIPWKRGISL